MSENGPPDMVLTVLLHEIRDHVRTLRANLEGCTITDVVASKMLVALSVAAEARAEAMRDFVADRIGDLIEEPVEPRGILSRIERHLARVLHEIDDSNIAGGDVVRALLLVLQSLCLAIESARDNGLTVPGPILAASTEARALLTSLERVDASNENRSPS